MESEEKPIIPQKGTEYPVLKYLYKYVKVDIATDWYEIGVELFDAGDETVLNTISENHSKDVNKCAGEMLKLWIARNPDATWNQLIKALKEPHIKLNTVAKKIASMLSKDSSTVPQDRKRRGDETSDPEQFTLSTAKKTKMADQSDDGDIEIDFTKCNVVIAFTELMAILQDNTPECRLPAIKARCITFTEAKFGERIDKQADNVDNFFKLLSQSYIYCNWLNFSLVEIIISALRNKKLKSLMNSYKEAIYSKTLGEVWKYIPQEKVNNKYYSEVTKTFTSKNPDDVTVKELIEFSQQLAYKIAPLVKVIANCLTIISLVPANKAYQLFLSMLTVPQESRQEDFLQIGTWVVHHPKSVLQKLRNEFAIASHLTLLIGYYHGVLLKGVNADLLFEDMCLKGLLNADQQSVISSGHSVHYRNWLLLEYIRCMEADFFSVFCKLVKNLWPEVGSQLIYVFNTIPGIREDSTKDLTKAQVISDQLHLYLQPSSVQIAFLCLIDQLHILLQHSDIEIFVSLCENMMASTFEQENIKLFSDTQIAKLKESKTTIVMLWRLNVFFTWSNHSILRMMVSKDFSVALQLLDMFDSRIDLLLSIASYPIPYFSCDMIPVDTSVHTILAIRCGQQLYECTLQYVYDIQSVLMEKCHITQHCLQLLAVRNDPATLYWTIPKCVVNLISNQVPCHSEYLYSKGVLEVLIYPELSLSTGDDIKIGSLGFIAENDVSNEEFDDTELSTKEIQKILQADNIKKRFRDLNMPLQVEDAELKNKDAELRVKQKQLERKNEEIKQLHKKLTEAKLLINSEKQNKQLNSKLLEVTDKMDQLNEENLKINSEAKLNERDKHIKQLKSELEILVQKEKKSDIQDDKMFAKLQLNEDDFIDSEDTKQVCCSDDSLDCSDSIDHPGPLLKTIAQQGSDRPFIRYLNRYIVANIAACWQDVGYELLENEREDEIQLNTIKSEPGLDNKERARKMLTLWLDKKPCASWNDLIRALRVPSIGLYTIALDIETMLLSETEHKNEPITTSDVTSEVEKLVIRNNSNEQQQKACEDDVMLTLEAEGPFQHQSEIVVCSNISASLRQLTSIGSTVERIKHSESVNAIGTTSLQSLDSKMESGISEKSRRICQAVSQYYRGQFMYEWICETNHSPIDSLAALLVERDGKMTVVVLTAGSAQKKECSYSLNNGSVDKCLWDHCDGHAVAVCYRFASLYLITEIYTYKKKSEALSILTIQSGGFALKESVKLHFFCANIPCGFMADEDCYFLSWKMPFKQNPHCLQCSSTILISAYLGIQGPLSHLFGKPVYISSITIPKCGDVTLKGFELRKRFERFGESLKIADEISYSDYKFHIPDVEITDDEVMKLFPKLFQPGYDKSPLASQTTERQPENKIAQMAGTIPDVEGNFVSRVIIFSFKISKADFCSTMMSQLKDATKWHSRNLKERQLKSLLEAQHRLCKSLNASKALKKQGTFKILNTLEVVNDLLKKCNAKSNDSPFCFNLLGCDWIRYLSIMNDDIQKDGHGSVEVTSLPASPEDKNQQYCNNDDHNNSTSTNSRYGIASQENEVNNEANILDEYEDEVEQKSQTETVKSKERTMQHTGTTNKGAAQKLTATQVCTFQNPVFGKKIWQETEL